MAFEQVVSDEVAQAYRLRVPGGWIYYIRPQYREPCAVFVPDPDAGRARHAGGPL